MNERFRNGVKGLSVGLAMLTGMNEKVANAQETFKGNESRLEIVKILTEKGLSTEKPESPETFVVSFDFGNLTYSGMGTGKYDPIDGEVILGDDILNVVKSLEEQSKQKISVEDFMILYHNHPVQSILKEFSPLFPKLLDVNPNTILTAPSVGDCFQALEDSLGNVVGPKRINIVVDPGGVWTCSIPTNDLNPDAQVPEFIEIRNKFIEQYNSNIDTLSKDKIISEYIDEIKKLTGIEMIFIPRESLSSQRLDNAIESFKK